MRIRKEWTESVVHVPCIATSGQIPETEFELLVPDLRAGQASELAKDISALRAAEDSVVRCWYRSRQSRKERARRARGAKIQVFCRYLGMLLE